MAKLSPAKQRIQRRRNGAINMYRKERSEGTAKEYTIALVCQKFRYSRKQIYNLLKIYGEK